MAGPRSSSASVMAATVPMPASGRRPRGMPPMTTTASGPPSASMFFVFLRVVRIGIGTVRGRRLIASLSRLDRRQRLLTSNSIGAGLIRSLLSLPRIIAHFKLFWDCCSCHSMRASQLSVDNVNPALPGKINWRLTFILAWSAYWLAVYCWCRPSG